MSHEYVEVEATLSVQKTYLVFSPNIYARTSQILV